MVSQGVLAFRPQHKKSRRILRIAKIAMKYGFNLASCFASIAHALLIVPLAPMGIYSKTHSLQTSYTYISPER